MTALEWLDYWNRRARAYKNRNPESREILAKHINSIKPRSLIEIGCGPGFLFELYSNIPLVHALDWSDLMLSQARNKCTEQNLNINVFKHDIAESPPEGHWQVALTRHCLMHIPPSRIENAVENIAEVCDEALIFEWCLNYTPQKDTGHCFLHDYENLFQKTNHRLFRRFDCTGKVKQTLFWFKKEK